MILPKYQWLIEEKAQNCSKFCDKLYVDFNADKKFQVKFEPTVIIDEDFDGDDIDYPLDLDEYVFDISHTPVGKEYVNSYSFVYGGQSYCYIFAYDSSISAFYSLTQYGNFNIVLMKGSLHKNEYRNAVNDYLAQFGISASHDGTNMTVTGLPLGTQIDIAVTGNYPTVSGITGTPTWGLNNFLPINDKLCFFNVSSLENTGATSTPSIYYEAVIPANHRVITTVQFTNSFGFDVDMDFIVRDNFFNEIEVQSQTVEQGTNTLQFCFTADASPPTYYILEFMLSDPQAYTSSIVGEMVGFCFNQVKIEEIGYVDKIEYEACDSDNRYQLEDDEYVLTYSCGYNALVNILNDLPEQFKLYIYGSDGTIIESKWYYQLQLPECSQGHLMRLRWTDTCKVGDIDYAELPYTNELYVSGVLLKQGLEKVEAIGNITTSGRKTSVYRHTIEQYELRLHPYTAETQQAFERVFEHATVYVDNDEYYVGDGAFYSVTEVEQFIYTGRVDLYLAGSEVIKSSCCC